MAGYEKAMQYVNSSDLSNAEIAKRVHVTLGKLKKKVAEGTATQDEYRLVYHYTPYLMKVDNWDLFDLSVLYMDRYHKADDNFIGMVNGKRGLFESTINYVYSHGITCLDEYIKNSWMGDGTLCPDLDCAVLRRKYPGADGKVVASMAVVRALLSAGVSENVIKQIYKKSNFPELRDCFSRAINDFYMVNRSRQRENTSFMPKVVDYINYTFPDALLFYEAQLTGESQDQIAKRYNYPRFSQWWRGRSKPFADFRKVLKDNDYWIPKAFYDEIMGIRSFRDHLQERYMSASI